MTIVPLNIKLLNWSIYFILVIEYWLKISDHGWNYMYHYGSIYQFETQLVPSLWMTEWALHLIM